MSTGALRQTAPAPDRESDPVFGIASGLYLALVASPFVLAAADRLLPTDLVTLYLVFLGTVVVSVALCWGVLGRRPDVAVRVGPSRWMWSLPLVGLVLAASAVTGIPESGVFGIAALFFGAFATLLGLVVAGVATSRHAAAVLAANPDAVEWTAGWPEPTKGRIEGLGLAMISVGTLIVFVGFSLDGFALWYPGQALVMLGIVGPAEVRERTFTVTPAGLVVRYPGGFARVRRWSEFEGYSTTEDAVRLHRPWRVDYRCALSELGDVDRVETALRRRLDRVDAASV